MDFKQIEAFVNVVKYRNFSRAADASFLTQPTISAHINHLEKELNTTLLNRQGREITLTQQGELFYPYAVNLMNTREQAALAIDGLGRNIAGVLELQASSIPGQYFVPSFLGEFRTQYPHVKVFLEQSDSKMALDNIKSQKGEIGFIGMNPGSSMISKVVFRDKMLLMTPNSGKFAEYEGDMLLAEEIIGAPFVVREAGSGTKNELDQIIVKGKPLMQQVDVVGHINNMEAIKQAVAGGLGMSVIPGCVAEKLKADQKVRCFHLKEMEEHERQFYMVRNKNTCLSPAGESFWNYMISNGDHYRNLL